jgi:hypothetical protein
MHYICGESAFATNSAKASLVKKASADERRNGRVVECGGLENRCPATAGPGVRIPLSPPKASDQSRSSCCGIFVLLKDLIMLA